MNDIIIKAENITKYFGDKKVLDNINLEIKRGTVYGLLGRNGCGKSTLIKILLGLQEPTRGKSFLFGYDSIDLPVKIKEKIGYMVEGHTFYNYMKIKDLQKLYKNLFSATWSDFDFTRMIEYFELDTKQKIKTLSRGQKAQINLALTLSYSPELLIMDDPALGLDSAVRLEFLEQIIEIIQNQGRTVFLTTHQLTEIERIADRVGIIRDNSLIIDSTVENLLNSVKKIKLFFDKTVPDLNIIDIKGVVSYISERNSTVLTIADFNKEKNDLLKKFKPEKIEISNLNLEEIFMEYTVKYRKAIMTGVNSREE